MTVRYAALDIGSNSVKLLVVEDEPQPRAVSDRVVITRLAESLQQTGSLSDEAMERTVSAIDDMLAAAQLPPDAPIGAIITAAGRRASNGAQFAQLVTKRTGVSPRIVPGEREAELSLKATRRAFPAFEPLLMADVGGASTELVRQQRGRSDRAVSLDIGAVLLTEQFLSGSDPPDPGAVERAHNSAVDAYGAGVAGLGGEDGGELQAAFIGGTATSLAAIHLGLLTFDSERVHGTPLLRSDLEVLCARLGAMSLAVRRRIPSLDPKRASVIFGGALLVRALAEVFGLTRVTVSDRGARWGLIWELMERFGLSPAPPAT